MMRDDVVAILALADGGADAAVQLHLRAFPDDLLARLGPRFLARYYRAFAESPHAVLLLAVERGSLEAVGYLLGTFDHRAQYSHLVRRHGPALAAHLLAQLLRHPILARDVVRRGVLGRYVRGALRSLLGLGAAPGGEAGERIGVLLYLVVDRAHQRRGIGSYLVSRYELYAWAAELDRLELVTCAGASGAGGFYERAGWDYAGWHTGHGGERMDVYTRSLDDPPVPRPVEEPRGEAQPNGICPESAGVGDDSTTDGVGSRRSSA